MLRRWSEGEFSKDAQYSLIPSLYSALRREGADFHSPEQGVRKAKELPSDPLVVSSQQEEDDLAKAIQLSLQEKGGKAGAAPPPSALYSLEGLSAPAPAPAPRKEDRRARALYDFEAAEDNELTFQAGEMVVILDDADPNWWKGSNHRGEVSLLHPLLLPPHPGPLPLQLRYPGPGGRGAGREEEERGI